MMMRWIFFLLKHEDTVLYVSFWQEHKCHNIFPSHVATQLKIVAAGADKAISDDAVAEGL